MLRRVRTRSSSPNITGVILPVGAPANTAWNIRAGKFGRRPAQNFVPISRHFTASSLFHRSQRRLPPHSLPKDPTFKSGEKSTIRFWSKLWRQTPLSLTVENKERRFPNRRLKKWRSGERHSLIVRWLLLRQQLPQYERQNSTVPVIIDLDRRIDAQLHRHR